jgi:hypothetical protein
LRKRLKKKGREGRLKEEKGRKRGGRKKRRERGAGEGKILTSPHLITLVERNRCIHLDGLVFGFYVTMKCTPLIFITVMTYLARCACDTNFFRR